MAKPHFCGLFTNQHSSAYIWEDQKLVEKGGYGGGGGVYMKKYRLACFYREEEYFATSGRVWRDVIFTPNQVRGLCGLENPENFGVGG